MSYIISIFLGVAWGCFCILLWYICKDVKGINFIIALWTILIPYIVIILLSKGDVEFDYGKDISLPKIIIFWD
jgi:hypothetical protein